MAITLGNIKAQLDNLDDEIDMFASFPFVGSFVGSIKLILDPIRKAVDGGAIDKVRDAVDQVDNEIDSLAKLPWIGTLATPLAGIMDRIRLYVDQLDPITKIVAKK